jgi:hypothetical protein
LTDAFGAIAATIPEAAEAPVETAGNVLYAEYALPAIFAIKRLGENDREGIGRSSGNAR